MNALFAVLIVGASTTAVDTFDLLWKPKPDQRLQYALKMEGRAMEAALEMSATVHLHVKKVSENGNYTLGTQFKGMIVSLGGEKQSVADEPEEVQEFNARGDLKSPPKPSDDPDGDVIGEILSRAGEYRPPEKPVKVGDTWEHMFPEDKKKMLPKALGTYRLVSVSQGKVTLAVGYKESSGAEPTSAQGTIILDEVSNTPLSIQCDVKNLRFQEGVPPGTMRLSMTLK